jgi:salicylate hydroxylase
VRVFEQAPQLAEIGAGIQFSANANKVLAHLGVLPAIAVQAVTPLEYQFRLHSTGEVLQRIPLGATHAERHGAPYFLCHRADVHRALLKRVQQWDADCVVLDARVVSVQEQIDTVEFTCANGQRHRVQLLLGADGIHSMVRQRTIGALPVRFMANVAWRCMVPASRLPPGFKSPVVEVWVGPKRHVVMYPLRGGELINFVGIVEDEHWQQESWTVKSSFDELWAEFSAWHPQVRDVVAAVDKDQCYRWAMLDRDPVQGWSTARTTLLGDAAHPTLPLLAQGANMAVEDGEILARAIEISRELPEALQLYQRNRYERTARIQRESAGNLRLFHNDDDDVLRRNVGNRPMDRERAAWLYSYDPLTVPLD